MNMNTVHLEYLYSTILLFMKRIGSVFTERSMGLLLLTVFAFRIGDPVLGWAPQSASVSAFRIRHGTHILGVVPYSVFRIRIPHGGIVGPGSVFRIRIRIPYSQLWDGLRVPYSVSIFRIYDFGPGIVFRIRIRIPYLRLWAG